MGTIDLINNKNTNNDNNKKKMNVSTIHNMKIGDSIHVQSNSGKWYSAEVANNEQDTIELKVNETNFFIKKKSIKFNYIYNI